MSTSSDSQVSQQWWIRSASNGDVFGPVPVSELADWARQSRVFPEDAVSTDRRSWRTARTVPELGMDTVIATPDGRIHGPLHAAAAATLAEKGKLPEGAKVFSASQLLDMGASEPPSAREDPKAREERDAALAAAEAAAKAATEAKEAAADAIAEKDREIESLRDAAAIDAKARWERDAALAAAEAAAKAATEAKEAAEEQAAKIAAAAEATSDELRLAKSSLEKAVSERDAVIAERDSAISERDAVVSERDSAIAERDAAVAERDAAVAKAEAADAALAEAKASAAEAEKKREEQSAEMAELADFANARDRESKAAIAELERRIAEISAPDVPPPGGEDGPVGDARLVQTLQDRVTDLTRERCALSEKLAAAEAALAVATRPLEADTALVKKFADEALDSLRAALASEKERNDAERTASVQRQNALHDRIADLERALRRQPGEKTRGELAEERSERTISQLRQEIDALREQHKADLGRASENERALEGRLQALQHREAAVREQLRRVEKRTADYDSLTSRLRRREEEIVEAEKQFGEARTQWQVVEQMLRRRIEELEHGAGSLFENDPAADATPSQKLVLPGWVKNMK